MWLARDRNKQLWFFIAKPWKEEHRGYWNTANDCYIYVDKENRFSDVKWEDKEPTEVKLVKK